METRQLIDIIFKIMDMNICILIFVLNRGSEISREHEFTPIKETSRLDVNKYSFSQGTINVRNKLSAACVHASSVNRFKNKIETYFVRAVYTITEYYKWTLDNSMASLPGAI